MANAMYGKGREGFANAAVNWLSDDIRCILIDAADYTLSIDTHDFLDDIPAGARVAVSGNLVNKTNVLGVLDADDVTFTSVTGDPSEMLVFYKHTGVEATSRLLANFDTAVGLPVTPNGGNITITFDSGVNKIFKL